VNVKELIDGRPLATAQITPVAKRRVKQALAKKRARKKIRKERD
jgi:hypothetical protein